MPDGVLLGILGGKGRPVSKSWPCFRPKNVISHTRFQTSTAPPSGGLVDGGPKSGIFFVFEQIW